MCDDSGLLISNLRPLDWAGETSVRCPRLADSAICWELQDDPAVELSASSRPLDWAGEASVRCPRLADSAISWELQDDPAVELSASSRPLDWAGEASVRCPRLADSAICWELQDDPTVELSASSMPDSTERVSTCVQTCSVAWHWCTATRHCTWHGRHVGPNFGCVKRITAPGIVNKFQLLNCI
jgi:hypothetical protein